MVKKHGNQVMTSVYMEPEQLQLLKELSAETRVPVSVYIREAVADVLSKHKKGVTTLLYLRVRSALKTARSQLAQYRRDLVKRKAGLAPLKNCDQAISRIDMARASVGD